MSRAIAPVVVLVLLVSGCGDSKDASEKGSDVTPRVTTTTSPAPSLTNTGTDMNVIFRSVIVYNDWLYSNPNPALADTVYDPSCTCFDSVKKDLTDYRKSGMRLDPAVPTSVELVTVVNQSQEDATLFVKLGSRPKRLLTAHGQTRKTLPGYTNRAAVFTLKATAGKWRISDIKPLANS